ncbi:hypothetical protein QB910_000012 [Dabrowskivirus KKP3916]|uniref:PhoH family protein n=1 Tax=Alicyclobacillus phage KKP_3916 TaxID=3040651 RepID=A0AAT9V7H8_9CAUD|nr:hypothetical protein QB910_000012 [Alicyclobacillus phage KKP 3916]
MIHGRWSFDTNALLLNPDFINEVETPIVCYTVLQELDKIKMERDTERGWQARKAVRLLRQSKTTFVDVDHDLFVHPIGSFKNNDDLIVSVAVSNNCVGIVTGDFLMQLKSKAHNLQVIDIFETFTEEDDYKGYLDLTLSNQELSDFYDSYGSNSRENIFNLLTNQYLILRDSNGNIIQGLKWNGEDYELIDRLKQSFSTNMFGKFETRDLYQKFAMDSLFNNAVTMIKGRAGSGKSLLSLNYAYSQIEKGKHFNKLICFVNPTASRGSAKLGYYTGNRNEKLLDGAVGSMFGAKFGDKDEVQYRIDRGEIMLLPFSDIRGFDTTGMKAIVYIVEAQNLDIDLMKLAIQRVGEDSKLIIDGDYNAQVDSSLYEGVNNGMRRVSQVFRGEDYYGEVELPIIYRSRMAAKAEEM